MTSVSSRISRIETSDRSAPNFVSNQGETCALERGEQAESFWDFLESGSHLVTAGMPRGGQPDHDLRRLTEWCRARGRRPVLFGVEPADLPYLNDWKIREIGRQPLFQAGPDYRPELRGPSQPKTSREMRRQARRALAKDVSVVEVTGTQIWELQSFGHLDALLTDRWQHQPLAEFSFLVALHLAKGVDHRRYFLLRAPDQDAPIGLGILVRSRRGWLLEHQLLTHDAPNGCGELLTCQLLCVHMAPGEQLSLGITPLYRGLEPETPDEDFPSILGFMPPALASAILNVWEPLYGFRRLLIYRKKLEPHTWEPVYWAHPPSFPGLILWAVLRVFAGGSFLKFALRSAVKMVSKLCLRISSATLRGINTFFVGSLLLWLPVLWHLDGQIVFGNIHAPKIWTIFDLFLLLGFVLHHPCLERGSTGKFSTFLLGLVSADAMLSIIGTLTVHQTWPSQPHLGVFLVLLNAAPLMAVLFLTLCSIRGDALSSH